MRHHCTLATVVPGLLMLGLAAGPVGATTLIRSSLNQLTGENESVIHAKVLGFHSYWNPDHSFILTDVRLQPIRSLKGVTRGEELVITLMGGTVDDLTALIVGGPELVPGSEYVLFLNPENLPGAPGRLTVRDLVQGVYNVVDGPGGRRAVSQANQLPLLPDAKGLSKPPGAVDGFPLEDLVSRVRALTGGR